MSTESLREAFVNALGLSPEVEVESLEYRGIEEWDSVAHMILVAELEATFDIMLDTQDVLDMSSYQKSVEILRGYGVQFDG